MKKAGEPGESPLLFFAAAIVIGRCAAVRAENAGGEVMPLISIKKADPEESTASVPSRSTVPASRR